MKMANNIEGRALIEHLLSSSEVSISRNGSHLFKLVAKGVSRDSTDNLAIVKARYGFHMLMSRLFSWNAVNPRIWDQKPETCLKPTIMLLKEHSNKMTFIDILQ